VTLPVGDTRANLLHRTQTGQAHIAHRPPVQHLNIGQTSVAMQRNHTASDKYMYHTQAACVKDKCRRVPSWVQDKKVTGEPGGTAKLV